MSFRQKSIITAFLLSVTYWIIDAGIDALFFHEGSFWDSLIFAVPASEIYMRLSTILILFISGMIISAYFIRRLEAEVKVESQTDYFKKILNSLDHPFYVIDVHTYQIKLSNSATNSAAHTPTAMCFHTLYDEKLPCSQCPISAIIENKKPVVREHEYIDSDGRKTYVELHAHPVLDEAGQINEMIEYTIDITERKMLEQDLKESMNSLVEAQEVARMGYYEFDIPGDSWTSSSLLDEIFGMDETQLKTLESWVEIVHPDQREEMVKYFEEEVIGQRQSFNKIYRILQINGGELRWVHGKGKMEWDKDGSPLKLFGTIQDITQEKLGQEKLEQQMQLNIALRTIDEMIISNLSLEELFEEYLDILKEQLGADTAIVWTFNTQDQRLELAAKREFDGLNSIEDLTSLPLKTSFAGKAAREQELFRIGNLQEETQEADWESEKVTGQYVSFYAAPLISKGELKGVVEVFQKSFHEQDDAWEEQLSVLANQAAIAIDNAQLFENFENANQELNVAYDETIAGWARTMEYRDIETEGHSQRVSRMSQVMAWKLSLSSEEAVNLRRGALLHDIGKIGIPDVLLLKAGKYTPAEIELMKTHTIIAYDMLKPIHFLRDTLDILRSHHERWDGTGYPDGLAGEDIPYFARIFAIIDVWDALRSDRPYRPSWTVKETLDHIESESGKHFDPEIVVAFLDVMENNASFIELPG